MLENVSAWESEESSKRLFFLYQVGKKIQKMLVPIQDEILETVTNCNNPVLTKDYNKNISGWKIYR